MSSFREPLRPLNQCRQRISVPSPISEWNVSSNEGPVSHRLQPALEPEPGTWWDQPGQGEDDIPMLAEVG